MTAREVLSPTHSVELAEFIGIMMGDGGMTNYQVKIALHSVDDAEYASFVRTLISDLFDVTPATYPDPLYNAVDIVVSRAQLVRFLQTCGLPVGNKLRHGLDIPAWITANAQYAVACVRGLVDTDGCVFTHQYVSNGKSYAYKKLCFTSASPALIASVSRIMSAVGLSPRISRKGREVRLDRKADVQRYFAEIGSSNPKHLKRLGI